MFNLSISGYFHPTTSLKKHLNPWIQVKHLLLKVLANQQSIQDEQKHQRAKLNLLSMTFQGYITSTSSESRPDKGSKEAEADDGNININILEFY